MGKKLEAIIRTFKQSPDANILLASAIAIYYFTDSGILTYFPSAFALKQYLWGHIAYYQTKKYTQRYVDRGEEVNEEAIKRVFDDAPCYYFGSRYALREYRKNNSLPAE